MSLVWYKKSQKGLLKDTKIRNTEEKPLNVISVVKVFPKKKNIWKDYRKHTQEKSH